jgi:hypothetical protein
MSDSLTDADLEEIEAPQTPSTTLAADQALLGPRIRFSAAVL